MFRGFLESFACTFGRRTTSYYLTLLVVVPFKILLAN